LFKFNHTDDWLVGPRPVLSRLDRRLQGLSHDGHRGRPAGPDLKGTHPLVQEVKKYIDAGRVAIIDAPPGTSCPVVEAVRDTDFTLWVTEPTPFGLNDLKLAVAMNRELSVPGGIIVNRSDGKDRLIEDFARDENIPILLRIPLDRKIAESYSRGEVLVQAEPKYREIFRNLLKDVQARVEL